jgi:hypothetical protein
VGKAGNETIGEERRAEMSETDKSIIPLGARGLQLTTFDELFRFSEFVIKAGFVPRGLETKEKVFLALQYGMELGLSPMITLQNAMVVNNRPAISWSVRFRAIPTSRI